MTWVAALQAELLHVVWPEAVLAWPECAPAEDPATGALLWRGLRLKVGMAYGAPTSKAPLNTGRADYYGSVPNLAARLMATARPGQALLEGGRGLASLRLSLIHI